MFRVSRRTVRRPTQNARILILAAGRCRIHRFEHRFSAQAKQQAAAPSRGPEYSVNFSLAHHNGNASSRSVSELHALYLEHNDALKTFLSANNLEFDEVSDIILRSRESRTLSESLRGQLSNYLAIKRELHTFPRSLHAKILQYARDTAHIGVG